MRNLLGLMIALAVVPVLSAQAPAAKPAPLSQAMYVDHDKVAAALAKGGPLVTAWELHKRWPGSELIVIEREGHGGDAMIDALRRAIARFALDGSGAAS